MPARAELGKHSGVGRAGRGHAIDVIRRHVSDRLAVFADDAFGRSGNNQSSRAKRGGKVARQHICVHVKQIASDADADTRDNGYVPETAEVPYTADYYFWKATGS